MEKKIGEVFLHSGIKIKCVKGRDCTACYFYNKPCMGIRCFPSDRSDNENVIFVLAEGEDIN